MLYVAFSLCPSPCIFMPCFVKLFPPFFLLFLSFSQLPRSSYPLPMGLTGIHLHPQHFSYELLNTRFQRDHQELQSSLRLAGVATSPLDIASVILSHPGIVNPNDPVARLVASTLKKAAAAAYAANSTATTTTIDTNTTININQKIFPFLKDQPKVEAVPVNTTVPQQRSRVFVFELKGDVQLTAAPFLTKMTTFLLSVAKPTDEVVCLLESSGGAVMDYGLGASQLLRFRRSGIKLTGERWSQRT